ncbi:hypothetical protein V865_002133 [Kwoniella europaea PYCC6329]|uniref:HNH endonuclease n=1 Tax=Kwoniella europaea PYCC6329 TaxID=1423913 RepID=A0AAX4KE58_9TREE
MSGKSSSEGLGSQRPTNDYSTRPLDSYSFQDFTHQFSGESSNLTDDIDSISSDFAKLVSAEELIRDGPITKWTKGIEITEEKVRSAITFLYPLYFPWIKDVTVHHLEELTKGSGNSLENLSKLRLDPENIYVAYDNERTYESRRYRLNVGPYDFGNFERVSSDLARQSVLRATELLSDKKNIGESNATYP